MNKLFIISNESIYEKNNEFFCDNIDLKSTPEGLKKDFDINILARKSKKDRSHKIKIKNIKIFSSIFSFLYGVLNSTKNKNSKYLVISITPYTFFACIFLKLFGKSPIVYLRSDGYGEYKKILGVAGSTIYHIMFSIVSKISHFISCRDYILHGKRGDIVSPSQLDIKWFQNTKNISIENFRMLYVGRIRIEKGVFSLLKIIENKNNIFLTIVGAEKNISKKINQKNVEIHQNENNKDNLIKFYDNHNIFILPSFTEGHPMVLLEALARKRPVIIFEEIRHVIGDKKGIFFAKRNFVSLLEKLNYIKENYQTIQEEMKSNKLPTRDEFILRLKRIISTI